MRIRHLLAPVVAVATMVPGTAHAADDVRASSTTVATGVGTGVAGVTICRADADADAGSTGVLTKVDCAITYPDGSRRTLSATAPGPTAVVVAPNASGSGRSFTVCVTATATFYPNLNTASDGPLCTTYT